MPGITPKVIEFAKRVEAIGCTVALPHLFGDPGRDPYAGGPARAVPYVLSSMVPACVSRDFHALATESMIVLPWDRAVLIDGELFPNPLYAEALKASR